MESNFSFLDKHKMYDDFTHACIEAEKSLLVSYATTAILTRRALELAVKWVFTNDSELTVPYQDGLSSLIHDYTFKKIIDSQLFPMLKYIINLGNKAVHTSIFFKRAEAVLTLKNLFEFIKWIDYSYSTEVYDKTFDESILQDGDKHRLKEVKTRNELQDLYERLGSKDKKLAEVVKENETLRQEQAQKRAENIKTRGEYAVNDISEFKTRKLYIDLEIQLAGWHIGTNCREEVEVAGMPNKAKLGYVDYVLYGDDGIPLAVIEAKRTSKDPRIGKQQAKLYADCLEKQYHIRPVIIYTNGFEYFIWDDQSYPERKTSGIISKKDLEWMLYKRENKKSLNTIYVNDDITNRAYQKMAIQAVCDSLTKGHRKSLLVMATGSGKTRTAISLVDILSTKNWVKNILFLADRRALVKQAKKNFKALLPNLSLCDMLDSKDNPESRMIFSTYPTMMNAIDETKDKNGSRIFTPGHFDLIIVDESHRSIYKKYQAIFDYFDSILVGLTATPKDDIDKNTYSIFDLEDNVPTYAYDLGEAISEGYLNPYHTIETKMKFIDQGISYDSLSDEEKELFEETFDDDITDIGSEALNKFLFNNNTVDTVLQDLMNTGLKVEGNDKLGKTIIFAKNKRHADFILERFNTLYPKYKDGFTKVIYNGINYVDTLIDDFSDKNKLPQIAISVDMLDTGIDIPELLNLVFFKKIRSKAKFWQMIGRGTRLCEDLFGVGIDKTEFRIFDYCSNFEFFRINDKGKEAKNVKSLTENLFNITVEISQQLQKLEYQESDLIAYRINLVKDLYHAILDIDQDKFNSRMKLKYIHTYKQKQAWDDIADVDIRELEEHIAPLITPLEDDELAKRFDYLMYTIEFAELKGIPASKPKTKVISTAEKLTTKGNISEVKKQAKLIAKVQSSEFWESADIFDFEMVRKAFRDLLKYLDTVDHPLFYTNFTDEKLEVNEHVGEFSVNNLKSYRAKVNQYLKEHENDLVIHNVRNNQKLSEEMIKHLENILWQELGTKEDYKKEYGEEPLLKLITKIVGLAPKAANGLFSEFLSDETLNSSQMEFVKLIVNFVIANGLLDKTELNEYPFTKFGSVVDLFEGRIDVAQRIIRTIDQLNSRVVVG